LPKPLTRAAETLYISQLSQQIKQLEAELGTTLFDRIGKRVILTEAGEIRASCAASASREQAQIAVQELEGLQRGELTVGTVQTVNAYMIWIGCLFRSFLPNYFTSHIQELSAD